MSDREVKGISPEEWMKVWHVYDAAMAEYEAMQAYIYGGGGFLDGERQTEAYRHWDETQKALRNACSRAKEGR